MTNATRRFILIDDDPTNNYLSARSLVKSIAEAHVMEFEDPENALEVIEKEFDYSHENGKVTLFLDLNMPTISGWEFLRKFEEFPELLKKQFNIYILSSSVDPADIQRAKLNPLVIDFIEKPLNQRVLEKLFD